MVTERRVKMGTCSPIFAAGCEFVKTCNTLPSSCGDSDRFLSPTAWSTDLGPSCVCRRPGGGGGNRTKRGNVPGKGERLSQRRWLTPLPRTSISRFPMQKTLSNGASCTKHSCIKRRVLFRLVVHFLKTEQETLLACKDPPCCHFVNVWSAQVFCLVLFYRIYGPFAAMHKFAALQTRDVPSV